MTDLARVLGDLRNGRAGAAETAVSFAEAAR